MCTSVSLRQLVEPALLPNVMKKRGITSIYGTILIKNEPLIGIFPHSNVKAVLMNALLTIAS